MIVSGLPSHFTECQEQVLSRGRPWSLAKVVETESCSTAAGSCVDLKPRWPVLCPGISLTLITSSLTEFTGGFPWRRWSPLPTARLAAHFLRGLAGPR